MNIILPANPDYLSRHFDTQVNMPYKNLTVYTLVENLLPEKKRVINGNFVYKADAATGEWIKEIIDRIFQMTDSEIISLWFKYKIVRLLIGVNEDKECLGEIPYVASGLALTSAVEPYRFRLQGDIFCSCRVVFSPVVFPGKEEIYEFWISSRTYWACKKNVSFSALTQSLAENNMLPASLYSALLFYLWSKPTLIDVIPNEFKLLVETLNTMDTIALGHKLSPTLIKLLYYRKAGYRRYEIARILGISPASVVRYFNPKCNCSFYLSLLKELIKQERCDLFTTLVLVWPEIFAHNV